MITIKGVTCNYLRSNLAYDIYKIIGNGFNQYHYELRNTGITEEEILSQYID